MRAQYLDQSTDCAQLAEQAPTPAALTRFLEHPCVWRAQPSGSVSSDRCRSFLSRMSIACRGLSPAISRMRRQR